MEKNILEQTTPSGTTTRYTEEKTGIPTKYVVGAAVGVVGLALLLRGGKKNGEPGFIKKYIMPLVIAAAYKKVMETVQNAVQEKEEKRMETAS